MGGGEGGGGGGGGLLSDELGLSSSTFLTADAKAQGAGTKVHRSNTLATH
jgi:hypothetical protein